MDQGLQVWDSSGDKILDVALQTSSILGTLDVTEVGVQTVTNARFAWGTPFFMSDSVYAGTELEGSFSGNTFTLNSTYNADGFAQFTPLTVYYGVF